MNLYVLVHIMKYHFILKKKAVFDDAYERHAYLQAMALKLHWRLEETT